MPGGCRMRGYDAAHAASLVVPSSAGAARHRQASRRRCGMVQWRVPHHRRVWGNPEAGHTPRSSNGAAARRALLTRMKRPFHTDASEVAVSCGHLAWLVRQRDGVGVAMTVRQRRDSRQRLQPSAANTMATCPCRFLPILPPITRNVTLPHRANPLELGMRADPGRESIVKSGKNGNVDRRGQHSLSCFSSSPHPRASRGMACGGHGSA